MARPMFRPIVIALQRVPTWPGTVINTYPLLPPDPPVPGGLPPAEAVTYQGIQVSYLGELVKYQEEAQ